jgi:hypothetical protein
MTEYYETGDNIPTTEIYLNIKDATGGSFSFRGGTSVGMWVQAGDTLLFDVVRDFVDESYHAGPTASLTPDDIDNKHRAITKFKKEQGNDSPTAASCSGSRKGCST